MAKQSITVFNRAHSGYRRAGFAFTKGDNVVEGATDAQILAITNDKRLVLQNADKAKPDAKVDVVGADNQLREGVEEDANQGTAESLAEVINTLQVDGLLELTKSGKPEIAQLEAASQTQVSAVERDAAWDYYNEHLAKGNA